MNSCWLISESVAEFNGKTKKWKNNFDLFIFTHNHSNAGITYVFPIYSIPNHHQLHTPIYGKYSYLQEKDSKFYWGFYIALFCIIGIFHLMPSPTAGERDIQKHRLISLILITDQMHLEVDSNEKRITTIRTMASPMEKRGTKF